MTQAGQRPLTGQVAVVTGASSGLGRATAISIARSGADVVLMARSADDLAATAAQIDADGQHALAVPLDLAHEQGILGAIDQAVARFGRIDVLVNAAATDVPASVVDLKIDEWDRVLAVNLRAAFILAQAVFPYMRQAGRGTIVNISSVAGKRGWANAAAYCASKFGLTGLTQALAAEGKPHGIRACVLYPGAMATSWGIWSADERGTAPRQPPPPTRALPADEIASLIVWIASAPPELVLNEAVVTPIDETGWP